MSYNVGHQIGNACWQLVKRFLEGKFVYCWIGELFPPIVMVAIVQPDLAQFLVLLYLGVNDYPWEIVGMDFVIDFTKR